MMLIGELSRKSGFSRDTIRWYEKIGLINREDTSRGSNNYRMYDQEILDKLFLIRQGKSFGFSLEEIKEMMSLFEPESLSCTVSPLIDSRLAVIEQKIAFLQSVRTRLVDIKEQCTGDCQEQILRTAPGAP